MSEYDEHNRRATLAETAAIQRLSAPQTAADASHEAERLMQVNKRNSPKPTVKKHVSARVQHALDILRGDVEV